MVICYHKDANTYINMNNPIGIFELKPELKITRNIYKTKIDGLLFCSHKTIKDSRGFFSELGYIPELEEMIQKPFPVKQISHARSRQNVIRGFHAENWSKYVQVISGECFSAIADVRPESPTFLNVEIFILGQGDRALDGSLYIPPRLGNSMCVLKGHVDYIYLFDQLYSERDASGDIAISLFDKDLNVAWPIPHDQVIISERDLHAVTMREKYPDRFP